MEEYIEKLISQIRCIKARPYIADEIRNHIEEQISENMTNGMSEIDAEINAVKDMGDPVEVGISMDKIHKPRVAWKMLIIVGIISILAILIQWRFVLNINNNIANFGSITKATQIGGTFSENGGVIENTMEYSYSIGDFIRNVVVGLLIMGLVYFLDYTFVARYSKIIGFLIIFAGIWTVFFGIMVNGSHYYVFNIPVSTSIFMMMYIPVYGAILYKYRGGGTSAVLKSIIWLIIPVFITLRIPNMLVSVIMLICMLAQLTIAVSKGWFKVNKRICIVTQWAVFMILPIVSLFWMWSMHMLAEYQMARIRSWLYLDSELPDMISVIRKFTAEVPVLGKSTNDIIGQLPNLNRDYVFTYVLNSYGSFAGILVISVLAILIFSVFSAVIHQKNELGLVMGCGCGMLLLINTVINIFCGIGVLPPASSFLPFFSAGGSSTILCYAFIGIVMSIYRYKDVYPAHTSRNNLKDLNYSK